MRTEAAEAGEVDADLVLRHERLKSRHALELRLADALANGGLARLLDAAGECASKPLTLLDPRSRTVARSRSAEALVGRPPRVDDLLAQCGPLDLSAAQPVLVQAWPGKLATRHLVMPVAHGETLVAWLVMSEAPARFTQGDAAAVVRAAHYLGIEYATQRRVAEASWNARSTLARQLVRGHTRADDLLVSAEYLGVDVDADRIVVYVAGGGVEERRHDDRKLSEEIAADLETEVLCTRGSDGVLLLAAVPPGVPATRAVRRVKATMRRVLRQLGDPAAVVGVSAVAPVAGLRRAYSETLDVVQCVERFRQGPDNVVAVDDLGPARLFVANSDLEAVRRYVDDLLGGLLGETPGVADLLRTLYCFFDSGRSVRESARQLLVHENTVRLRLAKIHDLIGLDVASDADDQLAVQVALLVLRLEGHPSLPSFWHDESETGDQDDVAGATG